MVAVSFTSVRAGANWAHENGFDFILASDREGRVIDLYDVDDEYSLGPTAYHAVFVIDVDGTVTYRKVARRRPEPRELLEVLDGHELRCCPGNCGETVCE